MIVFHALGAISDRFGMDFGSFGDQRSLRMLREQIFLYVWVQFLDSGCSRCDFWSTHHRFGRSQGCSWGFLEAVLASNWIKN